MQAGKGWPVLAFDNPEPLKLPPRPGIKKLTIAFYTTDCPVCHGPHQSQSEYVDCRVGRGRW